MRGASTPPRDEPAPRLAVGVRIRGGDEFAHGWPAAIAQAVAAEPSLALRALVRSGGEAAPAPAPARATSRIDRIVDALLGAIDRPLYADVAAARTVPDAPRTDADALGACDLVLEIDAREGPGTEPTTGVRTWPLTGSRIRAEIEASLLGGFDVADLVLRERVGPGADGTRVHAVHGLPAQSFSRTDRLTAAFGALPAFVASALVRVATGTPEPPADRARLAARDRLLMPTGPDRSATGRAARRRLGAALRLALRQLAARARDRFTEERWELAWHPDPPAEGERSALAALLERPVGAWRPLLRSSTAVRADPHALAGPDGIDLWFEELPEGRARAHVAHARLALGRSPDGSATLAPPGGEDAPGPALSSEHHLSFPFVFEHGGERLMVPETARARRLELYREAGSPRRWAFERTLVDGLDATDTALFERDGRWWLFTSAMSHRAVDERDLLLLYHAPRPTGPWRAHPANPVVRGVEGARMAGPVFELDGHLVRPSQYGARRYGHGLNLNRIDALDPERYAESLLGRTVPDRRGPWLGLHSISRAGGVTFVDRLRRRPKPGPGGLAGRAAERLAAALGLRGRDEALR